MMDHETTASAVPHQDWERLFDDLVELDDGAREARLAEIASDRPDLARLLRGLLAADRGSTDSLGEPLVERAATFVAAAFAAAEGGRPAPAAERFRQDLSGQRIGRYRLLRLLGRGGMAEVYLAERADGELDQQVALKRILPGLASEGVHRRFLRERRILAQLDHPGIARVLDGGRSDDGDPYVVLEYVDGVPLDRWCATAHDGAGATLEERLRLLVDVCAAVDSAHRKLVVHRDLKPSNILVTVDGRVKLLDFGIAKLLTGDREGDGDDGATRLEHLALTPAYAAPEQVLGQEVTTATDVFALGVIAYQLLAGVAPFRRSARSLATLAREVEGESCERPSAALRRAAAELPRGEVERKARRLEGDLDTILGKALAADPARRYAGAAELAADLRRFLERRPIRARPDSIGYQLSRFVARHRWAVAGGAIAVLSLLLGAGVAFWQASEARQQARRAERVRAFLVELFEEADPSQTRGETITAREVLAAGARRVSYDLASEPLVQAELLDAIAQVERGLGLPEASVGHARQALAQRRRRLGDGDPTTAASRVTLAEALFDFGDLGEARRQLAAAAPVLRGSPDQVRRYQEAAIHLLWQEGNTERAIGAAQRRIATAVAHSGEHSFEAERSRLILAGLLLDSSRIAEALAMARDAVTAIEGMTGVSGIELAAANRDYASILTTAGDRAGALARFETALALLRKVLGPTHPEVAFTEIPYGFELNEAHRYADAEAALLEAISILQPLDHYELASALRYLGFTLLARERPAEAERRFAEAEAIYVRRLGEDHTMTRGARLSRAWSLARLGRLEEAETRLRGVAADMERAEGPRSNALRTALKYLGEVRRRRGDAVEALALHRRARDIELELFGTAHAAIAVSDLQVALDLLALAVPRQATPAGAPFTAATEPLPPGAGSERPAQLAEARQLLDEGMAFLRENDREGRRLGELLVASGRVALAQGDAQRALRDLAEGERMLAARLPAGHADLEAVRAWSVIAQRLAAA